MCDTPQMRLLAYARQGADTEHEIRRLLRFHQQDGVLEFVRQALEERGDLGALAFLERVVEEAENVGRDGGLLRGAGEAGSGAVLALRNLRASWPVESD